MTATINLLKIFIAFTWTFVFMCIHSFAQDVTLAGPAGCGAGPVTGSWTVPCHVTSITVQVNGGGGGAGGGGGGSNGGLYNTRGGGGAGGGGYSTRTFTVSPGSTFTYSIGSGGCGGGNGGDGSSGGSGSGGGASSFSGTDGGGGPISLTANGGGGGGGGSGRNGSPGGGGAGGGASGGTTNTTGTAGNGGSGGNGGTGGRGAGPTGGAGGASTGAAGTQYGGGGAGGGNSGGGRGAAGGILITYDTTIPLPPTPTVATAPPTCVTPGVSTITNYNATMTYIFTPAGPTAGAGGIISGMVTGTSYTVTAGSGGCNSTPSASFSNPAAGGPPETPTISSTPASCTAAGTSTISNYSGTLTYIFSPLGPTAGAGGAITGTTAGTNYTVMSNDGSCNSTPSASFSNGAQFPVPAATIAGTLSYCSGNNTTLTASGGTGYAWTNASNNNVGNTAAVTVTQGTYTVVATNASGCTASASATVTENPTPVVTPSNNGPVCEGASLNLTVNTTAGATYAWAGPNGFSSAQQNPSFPTASPAETGTYTVTVTANTCTATGNTSATVNPLPDVSSANDGPLCTGATLNLTVNATPGATYSWTGPNGYTSNTQNPTLSNVTTAQAGTYIVSVTDAGCTETDNTIVTINQTPTVTPANNGPVCSGTSLDLTVNTTTGGSYSWTGPNGFTSAVQNPSITNVTVGATGTYTATVTANSCTATGTTTATVNPTPLVTPANDGPLCSGATLNLSVNTTAGATYSWTGPNAFSSNQQNPSLPNVTTADGGTYNISVTALGCAATGTTTVTVNPLPVVNPANDGPVCSGVTLNLSVNATPGATYSWTGPNGFTSAAQNPSVSNVAMADAGTYTITSTAAGCSTTATTDVVVNLSPTATAGNDGPVCTSSTLNLTVNATPAATYSWTGPNGFTSAVQNPSLLNTTTAENGTYTVTVDAAGCTATGTTAVVINTLPVVTSANNGPLCSGTSLNLTVNATAGATYSWTGPNGFTSAAQNPTLPNISVAEGGTYSITVAISGCSTTETTDVIVNQTPTVTPANNGPLCAGATLDLTVNTTPGATYSWTGPNSFSSAQQNPSLQNGTTAETGTYTVSVTDNGCTDSGTTTATINSNPVVNLGNDTTLCDGQTLNLNAGNFASYEWQDGSNSNVFDVSATGTYHVTVTNSSQCTASDTIDVAFNPIPVVSLGNDTSICQGESLPLDAGSGYAQYLWSNGSVQQTISITQTGNYSVTVSDNIGCSGSDVISLLVLPVPTVNLGNDTAFCSNLPYTLDAGGGGSSYQWSDGNATQSFLVTASGTYTVTVTNQVGCTASDAINITVHSKPIAAFNTNSTTGCAPHAVRFTDISTSASGNISTWAWNFGDGNTSTSQNNSHIYPSSGTYSVSLLVTSSFGCKDTLSINNHITVYPVPNADFSASRTFAPIFYADIYFTNLSSGADDYLWNFGTGTSSSDEHPKYTYSDTGYYQVVLLATNSFGCFDTASVTVRINPEFSFYVPNAFSPNGNGVNDVFKPEGYGFSNFEMRIFNRWGEQVFGTLDPNIGWDGTLRATDNEKAMSDMYVWQIFIRDDFNRKKSYTGSVMLMR